MIRRIVSIALAFTTACAAMPSMRDRATQTAVAAKGVVDTGAAAWISYADAQIERCAKQELPTKEQRSACLGPAARAPEVEIAFEAVRAAQLALFVALSSSDDAEVVKALSDLLDAVQIVKGELQRAGLLKS